MAWDRPPFPCIWVANSLLQISLRELVLPVSWSVCLLDERRILNAVKPSCFCLDGFDWNVHRLFSMPHRRRSEEKVMHTLSCRIGSLVALLLPALTFPKFNQYGVRLAQLSSIRVFDSLSAIPVARAGESSFLAWMFAWRAPGIESYQTITSMLGWMGLETTLRGF